MTIMTHSKKIQKEVSQTCATKELLIIMVSKGYLKIAKDTRPFVNDVVKT
jgi:hypothetical protein